MNIDFRDIKEGWHCGRVLQIMEGTGPHGPFLRMIFTITEGELQHYRFSGFVNKAEPPLQMDNHYTRPGA
ncbi:MAG: hypothetical protein GXP46_10610 [Deferribacteres bacterium]|nr:hypothetical protein [Deferribacteres bacterium]